MALFSLPMRSSAGPLILLIVSLLAGAASAHNGEIRPGPLKPAKTPVDLRNVRAAPRWSWLHWWEANREPYLVSPSQEDAQPVAPEQLDALRAAASRELLQALEANTRASLQTEAALALGKMRHEPALPALVSLASKGERTDVRRAALVAIGLLGSGAAEKELLEFNASRFDEQVAALAAIGLLPKIDNATLRRLRAAVAGDALARSVEKVGTSSILTWSLRHQQKHDNLEYFRGLLRDSLSPWVASEALLGLGGTRDRAAQRILEETLFGTPMSAVKSYDNLETLHRSKSRVDAQDPAGGIGAKPVGKESDEQRTGALQVAPELIVMACLRSSAAIAMGQIDEPRAGESLLRFLDEDVVKAPQLVTPKSFAIMSLTAYPSEATRDKLIGMLGKQDENGKLRLDVERQSPLRGFAALALGLYAKPYATDQGPADRPGFDRAVMTLAERLDDEREEEEVRTACAVALGLTQRTAVLPLLQRVSAKLEQRNRRADVPVFGFVLLGRALAGDKNVVDPAAKFLLERDDDTTASGILSRRAAVLSLGVTRASAAIPVLTKAWHLNHYVNREVILALRLVGGSNAATPVMERLRQSKDQEERAYMAQALGELLSQEHPTALSRLTAGSNYTVRNDNLLPLESLANGFLFDYLIASFGENW